MPILEDGIEIIRNDLPTKVKKQRNHEIETIKISRQGYTFIHKSDRVPYTRRRRSITSDTAIATIISPRLAKYKYNDERWHIIHIPTGLVIANVTDDLVAMVKRSFETSKWTLKGDNTLVLVDEFPFEMTCYIRYTVEGT